MTLNEFRNILVKAVMALYGSKAVAAGVTAAMSAALGFLTMPFKGTGINALKVGK